MNVYETECQTEIPQGVYTLEDLKELGEDKGWCPYFMTRHLLNHATIVVYNYQYMLDPKVKLGQIRKEGRSQKIVWNYKFIRKRREESRGLR